MKISWAKTNPSEFIEKKCALCNTKDYKKISQLSINNHKFQIVRCRKDNLIWLNPMPGLKFYRQLYSKKYFILHNTEQVGIKDNSKAETIRRTNIAKVQVDEWIKYGNISPGKFVEIGCGKGYLLQEAKKRGWAVIGVDISNYVSKAVIKKGLPIICGTLYDAQFKKSSFDYVGCYDFFEHQINPNKFLKEVHRILNPNGQLMMRLPIIKDGEIPQAHLIDHVYHYSNQTLKKILEKNGFEIFHQHPSGMFITKSGYRYENITIFCKKKRGIKNG